MWKSSIYHSKSISRVHKCHLTRWDFYAQLTSTNGKITERKSIKWSRVLRINVSTSNKKYLVNAIAVTADQLYMYSWSKRWINLLQRNMCQFPQIRVSRHLLSCSTCLVWSLTTGVWFFFLSRYLRLFHFFHLFHLTHKINRQAKKKPSKKDFNQL